MRVGLMRPSSRSARCWPYNVLLNTHQKDPRVATGGPNPSGWIVFFFSFSLCCTFFSKIKPTKEGRKRGPRHGTEFQTLPSNFINFTPSLWNFLIEFPKEHHTYYSLDCNIYYTLPIFIKIIYLINIFLIFKIDSFFRLNFLVITFHFRYRFRYRSVPSLKWKKKKIRDYFNWDN